MSIVWLLLSVFFLGTPTLYYLYLNSFSTKPWKLRIDKEHRPPITIIVPAYNEERTIGLKLRNLVKVNYPNEKIQILVVNDASDDGTKEQVCDFVNRFSSRNIKLIDITERKGKALALNYALEYVGDDIVVVSDADTFWSPDILLRTMPYMSDPSVGAITARGRILNLQQSGLTKGEGFYRDLMDVKIRSNESKIYSTVFFSGAFSAYKLKFVDQFNKDVDDSGTAFDVVQEGGRALLIKEAECYTVFPNSWKGKLVTKFRRGCHLIRLWIRCLKLMLKGKLLLPRRIAIPEMVLYLLNPSILIILAAITLALTLEYFPFSIVYILAFFLPSLLFSRIRTMLVEAVQDYVILFVALLAVLLNIRFTRWSTLDETRRSLSEEMLEKKGFL